MVRISHWFFNFGAFCIFRRIDCVHVEIWVTRFSGAQTQLQKDTMSGSKLRALQELKLARQGGSRAKQWKVCFLS
jgi:hypothetical protein